MRIIRVTKNRMNQLPKPKKKTGRPSIGTTRKVSLTLQDEVWALIDARVAQGEKQSAVLREVIESSDNLL
ncbi:hypothetical protein [Brevibacillus daliensis]|uniref:hypothetical protein n=1 Tax=Brevibacillus daliensis TaxID=2892995 RepID=UPI001E6528C9|nr:hypothetical protein [Brevibacillus daliensis]